MNRTFTGIVAGIVGVVAILGIVLLTFDIRDARENQTTYELVHDKTVDEYVTGNRLSIAALILVVGGAIFRFFDRPRVEFWGIVCVAIAVAGLVALLAGYARWALGGFDH
jgi:hypothetical protein